MTIEDLPVNQRLPTLQRITPSIEKVLDMILPSGERLYFGVPIYVSFNLTQVSASTHPHRALLLKRGADLPVPD
jgi:hypothetical protein